MKKIGARFRERLIQFPKWCVKRYPLSLLFSIAAAYCAVMLNHAQGSISEGLENLYLRVLYLWPFALFGNVAWMLRCEVRSKNHWPGLGVLCLFLVAGWLVLPNGLDHVLAGFWFAYWGILLGWLFLIFEMVAQRNGELSVCRVAWNVILAAMMATLSAMVLVGGIHGLFIFGS